MNARYSTLIALAVLCIGAPPSARAEEPAVAPETDVVGGFFEKNQVNKGPALDMSPLGTRAGGINPEVDVRGSLNSVAPPPVKQHASGPAPKPADTFSVASTPSGPTAPDEPQAPAPAQPSAPQEPAQPAPPNAADAEERVDPAAQERYYREMSKDEGFASVLKTAEALSRKMNEVKGRGGAVSPSPDYYRNAIEAIEGAVEDVDAAPGAKKAKESHRF